MPVPPPNNIEEYLAWLKSEHGVPEASLSVPYYWSVTNQMLLSVSSSEVWGELSKSMVGFSQNYLSKTKYPLIPAEFNPELKIKPFASFIEKTYRKNVIQNPNYPAPPELGWYLPENWFSRINDTIRTMFIVKYLDGVEFLADQMSSFFQSRNHYCSVDFEAREEGYYAAHFYTAFTCEVPRPDWRSEVISYPVEIQITTQLQEVIKILLHKYYGERRLKSKAAKRAEQKWQWDYTSDEFATNYLGHILHYVEGMIMDCERNKKIPRVLSQGGEDGAKKPKFHRGHQIYLNRNEFFDFCGLSACDLLQIELYQCTL